MKQPKILKDLIIILTFNDMKIQQFFSIIEKNLRLI